MNKVPPIAYLAFLLITGSLIGLAALAIQRSALVGSITVRALGPLLVPVLGAWIIALVLGAILIRDARPYTGSWAGHLIAWLGIGVMLVSLAVLMILTLALL
jgi:hypothetical protein